MEINKAQLIEGIFWKRKNARKYAQQLIKKTGVLNYKFLYKIITYKFKQQPPEQEIADISRNP
jgi:hypothetical protein